MSKKKSRMYNNNPMIDANSVTKNEVQPNPDAYTESNMNNQTNANTNQNQNQNQSNYKQTYKSSNNK